MWNTSPTWWAGSVWLIGTDKYIVYGGVKVYNLLVWEFNYPTDHIFQHSVQFNIQTTIQIPYFVHIYGQNSVHIFFFGQIGKMLS